VTISFASKAMNLVLFYLTPSNLNGSIKIELINLKIISNEKPTMRKGSKSNQSNGRINNRISANGQQRTNRMHHSKTASSVFIEKVLTLTAN
jgi:hypothetical protein